MAARFALGCALMTLFASMASAQTVFFADDFDGYSDQAAFEAAWSVVPTAPGGTNYLVTTGPTVNPPNDDPLVLPPSGSGQMIGHLNNGSRNERSIGETGLPSTTNVISFSFDFYDVDATQAPYRHHTNLQDGVTPTGANQLVSMGLNNNQNATANGGNRYMARILGYNPANDTDGPGPEIGGADGSFFKLNDFGDAGLRSTGWHNLRVDITSDDGLYHDYYFYVDGQLAEQVLNVGSHLSFDTMRSYDHIRLGSGLTSGVYLSYTDNISVVINPEPIDPPGGGADFNGDGIVDGADFLAWQRGESPDPLSTDDLDLWKAQFGGPPPAALAIGAVPEPTTLALTSLAVVASLAAARRR